VEDDTANEVKWSVPAGTPIRAYEWIAPPFVLIAYAVIETIVAMNATSTQATAFATFAASLAVAAAVTLWISGYIAYRDLDLRSTERYLTIVATALLVTGALLSVGRFPIELLLLVWAGRLFADRKYRPIRQLRTVMPARRWFRTAIVAAVVGILCLLLEPLAFGLGFAPLLVTVMVGRIVGPTLFGFAFRLRTGASGLF
jgi:hypothetical protein